LVVVTWSGGAVRRERERLSEVPPTLAGIDHGFSFPIQYLEKYDLPHDWSAFLDDFQKHWPTDEHVR
jgi:hypothetical protein